MTSIAYPERRQLTRRPSSNGLRLRRHHPTPPRVLRYRAGGLRRKRGAILCPLAKPSLLPIVRCTLRRDERGNVARSRLYFVGYVTKYAGSNLLPRALRLSTQPHIYAAPQHVDARPAAVDALIGHPRASEGVRTQDPAIEFPRIYILGTSVHKGKKKGRGVVPRPFVARTALATGS